MGDDKWKPTKMEQDDSDSDWSMVSDTSPDHSRHKNYCTSWPPEAASSSMPAENSQCVRPWDSMNSLLPSLEPTSSADGPKHRFLNNFRPLNVNGCTNLPLPHTAVHHTSHRNPAVREASLHQRAPPDRGRFFYHLQRNDDSARDPSRQLTKNGRHGPPVFHFRPDGPTRKRTCPEVPNGYYPRPFGSHKDIPYNFLAAARPMSSHDPRELPQERWSANGRRYMNTTPRRPQFVENTGNLFTCFGNNEPITHSSNFRNGMNYHRAILDSDGPVPPVTQAAETHRLIPSLPKPGNKLSTSIRVIVSGLSTVSEHERNDLASRTNRQDTVAQPNDFTFRPDLAGPSTRQDMPGPSTRQDMSGLNTRHDMPGPSTRQDMPGPSTRQDIPGPSTRQDIPGPSTRQDMPGPSTRQDMPGLSTRQDMPGPSTRQDMPGPSTRQDMPGPSTRQDMPGPSSRQDIPGLSSRQDIPGPSTRQDMPGPSTRKDVCPNSRKDMPCKSIRQDKPGPSTRPNTLVLRELPKEPRVSPRQTESNSVGTPAQVSLPDLPEPISFLNTQPPISHIGETELVSETEEHGPLNMTTTFLHSDDNSSDIQVIDAEITSDTDGLPVAELPRESDRSGRSSNNSQDIIIVDDNSTDQNLLSPQPSTSSSGPRVKASVSDPVERLVVDLPVEGHVHLPNPSNQSDEPQINENIIGLLECPVCLEYMGPPIFQCFRGHLVCSTCRPKVPNCPTCRAQFSENRNLAMEQVAEIVLFPCRNSHLGCVETVKLKDKEIHENNCSLRSFKCLLPQCEWSGFHREIIPHLLGTHGRYINNPVEQTMRVRTNRHLPRQKRRFDAIVQKNVPFSLDLTLNLRDLSIPVSYNWLVCAENEVFRINFTLILRNPVTPQFFGCVQYIGPELNTENYKYQIKSTKPRKFIEYCLTAFTVSDRRRCSHYYYSHDAFHMCGEQLKEHLDGPPLNRILNVEVCIMPVMENEIREGKDD